MKPWWLKMRRWLQELQALEVELESLPRTGRDSSNPGKPPSSDTLAQRATLGREWLSCAERRRQARETGQEVLLRTKRRPGQKDPGRRTHFAKLTVPTGVVHSPGECRSCGKAFEDAEVTGAEVRQVVK